MAKTPVARRALVVDDDPLIQEFIDTVLSAVGFQVGVAATGELGLESIKTDPPHLVILDMRLPGMNGLEVIEQVSQLPVPFPAIVGMSGAWAEAEQKAISLGAAAFIRKPLTPDSLIKTVEGALGGRFVWIDD